jgi:hypothetical protein
MYSRQNPATQYSGKRKEGFIIALMARNLGESTGDMLFQAYETGKVIRRKSIDAELSQRGLTIVGSKACCHAWLRGETQESAESAGRSLQEHLWRTL